MRALYASSAAFVASVEPEDGAAGVFRDAVVLARLSHPVDLLSLSPETFQVRDPLGLVPSRLELSPDGRVVIWRPERLLLAGVEHQVVADGLRDGRGRPVIRHESRFFPGSLAFRDLSE